ncbi:hypothetical protein EMIT048CA2_180038 [Pseudomonas chlororaphis]
MIIQPPLYAALRETQRPERRRMHDAASGQSTAGAAIGPLAPRCLGSVRKDRRRSGGWTPG